MGVADNDGLTSCAGRGMQLNDLIERNCEKTIGKRVAQNSFIGKRKFFDIFQGLNVGRGYTHFVHLVAVPFNLFVYHGNLFFQFFKLNGMNIIAAQSFDFRLV